MFEVAALEGMDAVDHAGNAAGQQVGHPDRDEDYHRDHQQCRAPEANGGTGQAALDAVDHLATLGLETGILFIDQRVDATSGFGGGFVEVIDIGTDGDEAEPLRRLAVLAGVVGDGGGGRQFPQAREEDDEGAGAAVFGEGVPAVALRRKVEIAAVERDGAGLDQRLGRLALEVLVAEGRDVGEEFVRGLAAGLPLLIKRLVHPRGFRQAGLRVVADDEVIAWMRDRAALVIPEEGVIALDGIRNRREAFLGRHQPVGKLADMIVVERQCDVAADFAALNDRHRPADDASETLADGVFGAGVGGCFRGEWLARFLKCCRQVGADGLRRYIGADDVRDVDFARFELFQLGEIGFGLDEGIAAVNDVFQRFLGQVAGRDLDLLVAGQVDKGHFDEQRAFFGLAEILRWPGVEVLGVVGQHWPGHLGFTIDGLHRHPRFAILGQLPGAVLAQRAGVVGEEATIGGFGRRQLGGLLQVAVAVVEKVGDFLGGVGGHRLDGFPRAQVEGADRVVGDGLAHGLDCGQHGIRHAAGLDRYLVPQLFGRMPGKPGQQDQRHDLDDDENADQLAADTVQEGG